MNDNNNSRRTFVKQTGVLAGGMLVLPCAFPRQLSFRCRRCD
jgi:hypothetical protein